MLTPSQKRDRSGDQQHQPAIRAGQWLRRFETQAQPGQSWEDWTGELARRKNIPLGRFGRPEEAAQALFYLATAQSSYTTGSHIDVSGGNARHV